MVTGIVNKFLQLPFNAVMFSVAAALMLFLPVAVNILVLVAWLTLGIFENAWNVINFWIILFVMVIAFLQYLLSSFLFGVANSMFAGKLVPPTSGLATFKMLLPTSMMDRISETIDAGWDFTSRVFQGCIALTVVLLIGFFAVFFHDIVFITSLFRGMAMNAEHKYPQAIQWYKKCVYVAGPEREPYARFLFAGALVKIGDYREAVDQLEQAIDLTKRSLVPNSTLLLFFYTTLSDVQQRLGDWKNAEHSSKEALKLFQSVKVFPEVELRFIGDLKNYSEPEQPRLVDTLHALEKCYLREGRTDEALKLMPQIFDLYNAKSLTPEKLFHEMYYFDWQKNATKEGVQDRVASAAVHQMALSLGKKYMPSRVSDDDEFLKDYEAYKREMDRARESATRQSQR